MRRAVGWPNSRRNSALFLTAYVLLRVGAGSVEGRYDADGGFNAWHVAAGLDVVLFLFYGWRWWPLPLGAAVARMLLFPATMHASVLVSLAALAPYVLLTAAATAIVVGPLRVRFPLRNLRDVGMFAGVLCVALPASYAVVSTATFAHFGRFAWIQVPEQSLDLFVSSLTAIVVVVPVVTQLVAWRSGVRDDGIDASTRPELWIGCGATAIAVVLEYAAGARAGQPVLELTFVPLAWLAVRRGMFAVALGIFVAELVSVPLQIGLRIPQQTQMIYAGYLAATALTGLLLGAVTTERNRLLERLERGIHFDELTHLPNRKRLAQWIENHRNAALVLVMLDIDDLRLLNEGIGRAAVDRVLSEFATRLRTRLPPSYFVARVSSDEFAVALVDDRSPHAVIAELRTLLEAPFEVDSSHVFLEASAGAVGMVRAADAGEILRRADLALHRAKRTSTRSAVYSPDLHVTTVPLLVVELHQAVDHDEFIPFYQPIYRYDPLGARWQIAGAEALLRWVHPQRGLIGPEEFIDLLGRLAIGDRVGWNVVEASLRLAKAWRRTVPDFRVWVNLFARQALGRDCVDRIAGLLASTGAPAQALAIEISERTVVSEERDVAALVRELHDMGILTAIDDFGTGGSSLGRVREVPADVLKIDRSFVTRCEVDPKAKAVAAAVVRLASDLGMAVVAEGVENTLQVEAMLEIGCEYAQGYALGHPVPLDLLEQTIVQSEAV